MLRRFVLICVLAASPTLGLSPPGFEKPDDTAVVILATGADLGYVDGRGCHKGAGGVRYRPALDRWIRDNWQLDPLWMSTGNLSPYERDDAETEPLSSVLQVMSEVDYDAIGLGRVDLDADPDLELLDQLARDHAFVSANTRLFETGRHWTSPHKLIRSDDLVIGVVAASDHLVDAVWGDARSGSLLTTDPVEEIARATDEIRSKADVVVLLSTLGFQDLRSVVTQVDGIDVVLASRTTLATTEPELEWGTPVLWLGTDGLYVGVVTVSQTKRIDAHSVRVEAPFPVELASAPTRVAED